MANSPENRYPDGQDMSRLWYGDPAEDPQAYNKDQTWEQWQNENIERNLSEWFGDDQTAIEIAKEVPMMDNESKEDFIKRIWNSAIRRDNAEKIAPARPDEALDEHNARASYLSQFDIDKPLWGQMNTEQKRDLLARYPKYEGENRADWQVRVEGLVGAKIWANTEQQPADAGDQAGAGAGEGATAGGEAGDDGAADGGAEGPTDGGAADGSEAGDGGADDGGEADSGEADDGAADGDAEEGDNGAAEESGYKPLRSDFENFNNWSPAEQAAAIAAIIAANKARKAAEGGNNNQPAGGANEGENAAPAAAETNDEGDGDDDTAAENAGANRAEKKGLGERFRNSKIGRKAIAIALMAGLVISGGLLLSKGGNKDAGPTPQQGQEEAWKTTDDDEVPVGDPTPDDSEKEKQYEYGFTNAYKYYNCEATDGIEKNSNIAFCNANQVFNDVLQEHPEWGDMFINQESFNKFMNEVQLKLCQDMPEYFAATIYFQNETDGGWDEIKGMTYQEVEAYVENLDAEGVNALFVKLVQKQGESSWTLETPNEGDIATTSGTKDKNAENNKGTAEFIADPSEGELVLVDHEYNGKETVAVMHLPNGGTINVRVNITKDGAIFDGKGLVSEFQITPPPDGAPGCNNPEAGKGKPTPDNPTPGNPTPGDPTPGDPTPDKPTPTPTPGDPTPDNPTPTPTPTPEGKTPLADKEGNEQEGTSSTGLTGKPIETEAVNPDTNAGASAAPETVEKAPDSSSQAGAGMDSETTKSQDGGTIAEKVNDGDKSGGENGENTAAQKNTEPQTEAKKKQQEEDNKGKAAEASSSSSNKKKPSKSAEQKSAENQAEEDKNDADLYKNGYFAI